MSETANLFAALLSAKTGAARRRPALRRGATVLTYADLEARVLAAAGRLAEEGVEPGDRVLLALPNSIEYVVAFFAIAAAGAVAVPVDPKSGSARLDSIVDDTSPKLKLDSGAGSLLQGGAPRKIARPAPSGEAVASILFSAGSTGRPKGAILRHRQFLHIAQTLAGVVGMSPDHRELSLSPMTHSGGWQRVTATLSAGGLVVVPEGELSIQNVLDHMERHGINAFFASPPLVRALLKAPPERARAAAAALGSIESASAPLAPEELSRILELFPDCRFLFQYGLTECSRAFILDARSRPDKLGTVGLPTAGVEARIAGADGAPVNDGESGEICLRAPQLCEGYWKRPELAAKSFRDGWFLTGDFGAIDSEGFLRYQGRRDDKINCGGFSYFPAEVERELGRVEGVQDYMIAGVPDPSGMLHEVPWAFVVPASPTQWSAKAFVEQARRRLPSHMVPRKVIVVESIPVISGVKPDRKRAVELYGPEAGSRP